MTDTMVVIFCTECREFWSAGTPDPPCVDPEHRHGESRTHRHRTVVALPGGSEVVAVSFDGAAPYVRDVEPAFGLYLDTRWSPPWLHEHVDWPDFGVPSDITALRVGLAHLLRRAGEGQRVEMGCFGGHGRTGTALACLVALAGVPVAEALAWARANYCEKAVETEAQEAFVLNFLARE